MTVLARAFHGLTAQRLAVPALLGLVLCLFNWPVAIAYAQGLPASTVARAFVQNYLWTVAWFYAGLLAGIAAYNLTRGGVSLRVGAAAVAVGAVVWMVLYLWVLVRDVPFRHVFQLGKLSIPIAWFSGVTLVGLAVAALLYMRRSDDVEWSLESEAKRALDLGRGFDEARLQAMQAQIEPHFLFNTLANVRRLYESDAGAARAMLRQFISMLGQTLADIRTQRSTLAREVALAVAYLNVQKIRMGERLAFAIDIPPSLREASLPPMMLSTLVENAVKHGLAPLPAGGRVVVRAHADGEVLHVEVADTGQGLSESTGSGVGLANIETRLAALFGDAGRFGLEPNEHGGVTAHVELPLSMEPTEDERALGFA